MSLENYGHYQLVKRLAMGGMAQIYLARRRGPEASNELVVVKRILPHLAENLEFVRMFLDEARIAARLAHPNIVQIHDLGAQDDSFFLAMEYIHGEDVRRMWKRAEAQGRSLPIPLACRIIADACAGLDYAHKKTDPAGKPLNIVHRDVSPQNILVSFEGAVKVVDFGIAKAADQATVTRSGVLKGKYSYMSPEQAAGKRVDCRSDVFALGVVLYELLTQTRLFKRSNDMQTLSAVAECQVTPPSQVSPRVPATLDAIVMQALAKDPEDRYAEALQLQEALEEWLSTQPQPTDLAAFMSELYAERLAREARAGMVVVDEDPPGTGQRSALEGGPRRSGIAPSVSSRDVTRADRGELLSTAQEAESTDRSPPRPSRAMRSVEPRRDPMERRTSGPRPTLDLRKVEPEPSLVTRPGQEVSLLTDMTHVPPSSAGTWRRIAVAVAGVSLVAAAVLLWVFLRPEAPPPLATVRLESVPPGAQVVLDGKTLPGVTPLVLPPMAAGSYPVVVTREGYQELHAAVAIPATGQVTLEALTLVPAPPPVKEPPPPVEEPPPPPPAQVQLTLETEPAQAVIFVNGQERGRSPVVVAALAEQELEVKVDAPQHETLSRRVKVGAGPSQVERLVLEPLPKPPPPNPQPIKPSRPDPPRPSQDAPKALVRFAVTPWAEVSCNGRSLGSTPFPDVSLPVGTYQCKFFNPDLGRTLSRNIEVKATALNTVKVKF